MNLMQLKYVVEVAQTHSISKAAENLYMNQPNLSRAIKELEESLGVVLFNRSPKGITLTREGEEFLVYAQRILNQMEEVESLFKFGERAKQRFSISVPRATYAGEAFIRFAQKIDRSLPTEIFYKETNTVRAIRNIMESGYNLGLIRYQSAHEQQFHMMLEEKGLTGEAIFTFRYMALMSKNDSLAQKKDLRYADLNDYVEIAHADPYVPAMPMAQVRKAEYVDSIDKRIYVFERTSQYELLRRVPNTVMWVSPVPQSILDEYGLVQLNCVDEKREYKDVLVYKKGYVFSRLDELFVKELWQTCGEYIQAEQQE